MKYLTVLFFFAIIYACGNKLAEEEYYTNAKNSYANQDLEVAVENFKGLVEYYPESKYNAEALFMLGFINANDVKDFDNAQKYYSEFLKKYPDHELAFSAKYELENLGKDINELSIFKEIESDTTAEASAK